MATVRSAITDPAKHAEKLFTLVGKGNDGKMCVANCLASRFGTHARKNPTTEMIVEKHNDQMDTYRALLEEAQNDNYTNHVFAGILKRIINRPLDVRDLCQEVSGIVNHMIFCMLSNDPCMDGLTREDWALISRLVRMGFISMNNAEMEEFDSRTQDEYDPQSKEFVWSPYLWQRDEYQSPAD
jgi:hypothetical protein